MAFPVNMQENDMPRFVQQKHILWTGMLDIFGKYDNQQVKWAVSFYILLSW